MSALYVTVYEAVQNVQNKSVHSRSAYNSLLKLLMKYVH